MAQIFRLKANKGIMVNLLRAKGYTPTVKQSRFRKGSTGRTFQLCWKQCDGDYEALLYNINDRPHLKIYHAGVNKYISLTVSELDRYDLWRK